MESEEVNAEELGNNPAEVGTPEQSEAEPTQTTEEVEATPETAPEVVVTEEAIREAQRRFTPAQQRLAEELRQEREQRLEMARRLEELQGRLPKPEEKKAPEEPEPDPVMDPVAYQKWAVRQEIKPIVEELQSLKRERETERVQKRVENDYARLVSNYPDLRDESSELARTFEAFLTSKDPDAQQVTKLYRNGQLKAEQLLTIALGSRAPAVAEAKVKQDLARKASAQVAGAGQGAARPKAYSGRSAIEDAVRDSILEEEKKKV